MNSRPQLALGPDTPPATPSGAETCEQGVAQSGGLPARDDLLRAAVYAAYNARGTVEFPALCRRVVDVHRLWPLIEYEHAIERAEASLEAERLRQERELVESLRVMQSVEDLVRRVRP